MRFIGGFLLFLIVFFAAGVGVHYALYNQLGAFVWSLQEEDSGKLTIARTTLDFAETEGGADGSASGGEGSASGDEAGDGNVSEGSSNENGNSVSLFNGKDLGDWEKTRYGGEGDVFVNEEGNLEFGFGAIMTGVHWGGEVPATSEYEIELEAMKLDGNDFFCALTFPVKESHATFVIGGWGGGVVGISCVDDLNASENETMQIDGFDTDVWHKIRVRVTDDRLDAWIDDDHMVDLPLRDRKISLLPGDIELSVPIGIASYTTRAQYRNIRWIDLSAPSSE